MKMRDPIHKYIGTYNQGKLETYREIQDKITITYVIYI